ncbi:NAD(P)-dependent oxidoreductase [Microbacterium sp. SSW1-49]|uniref:NAD(P)-dependent oxidoreductase n=1 Tax=Microbacterium croceum TaxID=2851645 RepID=A0ABT0FB21_9MICO|nr:NAD(P)-dependent oxidoreductase [Microbacterium croceum]MCK2034922.1 NAD(P)-dependent oxidoreductase [Microbacterium croceum]
MGSTPRVALLGGAGLVGSELSRIRHGSWQVSRIDVHPGATADADQPAAIVDVLDEAALTSVLTGVDIVVHLANVPVRTPPPYPASTLRDAFAVNVGSVYTGIRASAAAGVGSFIHVSSMSVFADSRSETPEGEGDALESYGLSKRLAEHACAAMEDVGPTVTSIRIAFPTPDDAWPLWLRPSDSTAIPLTFDDETYTALRISDLARAIDILSARRGRYARLALAGDARLAPTVDDLRHTWGGATA